MNVKCSLWRLNTGLMRSVCVLPVTVVAEATCKHLSMLFSPGRWGKRVRPRSW